MSQINKHLKWCLSAERRLKIKNPDKELAKKHLKKSEYNAEVLHPLNFTPLMILFFNSLLSLLKLSSKTMLIFLFRLFYCLIIFLISLMNLLALSRDVFAFALITISSVLYVKIALLPFSKK